MGMDIIDVDVAVTRMEVFAQLAQQMMVLLMIVPEIALEVVVFSE